VEELADEVAVVLEDRELVDDKVERETELLGTLEPVELSDIVEVVELELCEAPGCGGPKR